MSELPGIFTDVVTEEEKFPIKTFEKKIYIGLYR